MLPGSAGATGRDFVDETLVAQVLRRGEVGIEVGSDARVDRDDRLQGWFQGAFEVGLTSRWMLEGVGLGLDRGRGVELGGWHAESRYQLLDDRQAPVAVAAGVEWEVETSAAKHPLYERMLVSRVILSRRLAGTLLATANLGWARQLDPVRRSALAWAAGVRWPERGPVVAGLEITREPIERATHLVPQLALDLPAEMRVRLGGAFGVRGPYRFIARVILEKELEL